ncbi:TIGR01212 family radical SAM protein [Candidatus Omnitrophota bacterium]
MKEKYYKFSTYLKEHFKERVHRVSLDAGFSCPNRGENRTQGGCIYCDNQAFSLQSRNKELLPLDIQISQGIDIAKKIFNANKFIVYFQAYSNTYDSVDKLKERYDTIRKFDNIVGLSIATRPDCINDEILDLIKSYSSDYEIWVELGLQSIHDKTLQFINRGHAYQDFLKAYDLIKIRNIKVCAHVILGLPNETREMMRQTAEEMARLRVDGIKIHPMHVVKGTKLHEIYKRGEYRPLEIDEYVSILKDFLAIINPDTVIHRLSAYCPPELLVVPSWISKRGKIEQELEKTI